MKKHKRTFIKSMNSIWKVIYIVPLGVLLNSCFSNCNEINLSAEDKTWIKCYQNIDTLLFTSNKNNVDTFVIQDRYNAYTTCSKFELGPDVYNYMGIEYLKKNNSKKSQKHIYLSIDKDFQHGKGIECIKSFQIYDLNASFDSINKDNLKIRWIDIPSLSKHKIKSMYFEKGDQFSSETSSVKSFLWSKKYGLLQYVLTTGETYSLTKRK